LYKKDKNKQDAEMYILGRSV